MSQRRNPAHRRAWMQQLAGRDRPGQPLPPIDSSNAPAGQGPLRMRARRNAMGSYFEVVLPANAPGAADLAHRMLDQVDAIERQCTIYRDDSELARINATAHLGPVAVEPRLFDLLGFALAVSQETQGAYDIASGALSLAWGFVKGPRRVPTPGALGSARECSGSAHVRLDLEARTIAFDRPGIVLNLGSIGKGYGVDRAVEVASGLLWTVPALVHGGQSSLYALGHAPDERDGRWRISLRDPSREDQLLGIFKLRNRGLGTSGATVQYFEKEGRRYGHLIDPRTGIPPASGPVSVTVLAPTAAEADALSTAFYLDGIAGARAYRQRHPQIAALFVSDEPGPRGVERLVLLGVNPEEFDLAPGIPYTVVD